MGDIENNLKKTEGASSASDEKGDTLRGRGTYLSRKNGDDEGGGECGRLKQPGRRRRRRRVFEARGCVCVCVWEEGRGRVDLSSRKTTVPSGREEVWLCVCLFSFQF